MPTKAQANRELNRRGKFGTPKDSSPEARKQAQADETFHMTNNALAEIAGVELAKKVKSTPKTSSSFDRSNPLGLSALQQAVREHIRTVTHMGEKTVLYKSGAKKGQIRSGFNYDKYASLMDEAGIPRQIRDTNPSKFTKRPFVQRGKSGKVWVTEGDTDLTEAFATENGIEAPTA